MVHQLPSSLINNFFMSSKHLVTPKVDATKERVVSDLHDLRRCTECVMPETQDAIEFDEAGICITCRSIKAKGRKIDWEAKKQKFEELIGQFRGKYDYDCIIPFSGGKDSTYTAYFLVKEYGLKPLIVSFDHHMLRPKVLEGRERTLKRLGCDYIGFKPDWQLVKKLMRIGLERKGDILWYQHNGIFAYPMQMAIKHNIPLLIWGEPSAEYNAGLYNYEEFADGEEEEVDETRFDKFASIGIRAEDMIGMVNEHPKFKDNPITMRDMAPYVYPKKKDLKAIGCRSVLQGTYFPWDVRKQSALIRKELGWEGDEVEQVHPDYFYEKVEDMMQGVQDYLKFIKRGYGRMSHLASIDIRNGRMTREEGMKHVEDWEGQRPASLDVLLEWLEMSEEEFYEITCRHAVSPWKHDPSKTKKGKKLHDQDMWVIR
jgi:N-acetyl sugar amidotransferase